MPSRRFGGGNVADFDLKEAATEAMEKFKKIPPMGKVAILGGVGLAAYLLMPRTESVVSAADLPLGTMGEGYSGDGGGSGGSSGSTDSSGGNSYTNPPTDYDDLGDRFDQVVGSLDSYKSQAAEAEANAAAMSAQLSAVQADLDFEKALGSVPSIYFDSKDDTTQFASVIRQVESNRSSGTFTDSQAAKAISKIAGTGNNGVGWKEGDNAKISQTLSNSENKAAETRRVQEVIKNREAAGLDTKLQKEHAARFGLSI